MKRTFTNFSIETNLEKPVTSENFYKHNITIRNKDNKIVNIIKASELSLPIAENFIYCDEDNVKDAIKQVINNRLWWIEQLRSFYN